MFYAEGIGWVEVIAGGMFSGKSEELISRAKEAINANKKILVFNHSSDTRYGVNEVVSHNNKRIGAICLDSPEKILEVVEKEGADVVCIDEAQFFGEGLIAVCDALALKGIRVIVAGLDMDFRGEPFSPMDKLMAKSEWVKKLNGKCSCCGKPSTRTQRIVNGKPAKYDDPIILVGSTQEYRPVCRKCHIVPRD